MMRKVMGCGLWVVGFWMLACAAQYGVLSNGELFRAPYAVRTARGTTETAALTEAEANAVGFKLVVDEPPACASNEYAAATGWTEVEGRIRRVYERRTVEPKPRKFSKLKIYGAISALDANDAATWQRVQSWLVAKNIGGVNGWTAFVLAQEVSEDHPLFETLAEEARELLGLSQPQFDAILNACILED